ncbi:MAG TPA: patatin-like phospholipase family protein [Puia sp.]|nr:patatin-like phospholipase family protein [Puia sp.]
MMRILKAIYCFFPVQLLLLHVKKFQVLLIFWLVLFSTLNGGFMRAYGAAALFLSPEYLGDVSPISTAIVGMATGVFVMSWNITTFILFCQHFRFLATTTKPFLKYCINNAILPIIFLVFYFVKVVQFSTRRELLSASAIIWLSAGFLLGFCFIIGVSLFYFFRADKTIIRRMAPVISNPKLFKAHFRKEEIRLNESRLMHVKWYLNSFRTIRKTRDVAHYSADFIENIFNRHHIAAVLSIFVAFIFLIAVGFFMDSRFFQLPAAASILIFFTILISLSGAFSYFLQSWSIPFFVVLFFILNLLYQYNVIDPTNKAYGLSYNAREDRPLYDRQTLLQLCSEKNLEKDEANMLGILEKWKARQSESKPILFLVNTSGGGSRSATFTMSILQRLDSLSKGKLMRKTFMITGASGGMLGAAYFRELSRRRDEGDSSIYLQDHRYIDDISGDLLNTLFSSFVARDLASPAQKFTVGKNEYVKDRGFAFEQKLNYNTRNVLNRQLKDIAPEEAAARMPLMLFNPVITRDSRALVISTQPVSFLMRPRFDSTKIPAMDPDAVDFGALFAKQDPMDLRLLTALRMNATFPYVLPNVWLPTRPVIDVMDAGFRDNFGEMNAIRFLNAFREWLQENTSGVVLLQIRDRKAGGWENPYESDDVTDIITKPLLLLQDNWYKMQEYNQDDLLSLSQHAMGFSFRKLIFQYVPKTEDAGAALNFHLTKQEKLNITGSLDNSENRRAFSMFRDLAR